MGARTAATLKKLAIRLWRRSDGSAAMTFGLALIPIVMIAGAAVDYSRANAAKAALQAALDSAVLAAAAGTLTQEERIARGQKHFATNFAYPNPPVPDIRIEDSIVQATAQYMVPTTLMAIAAIQHMNVGGVAHASAEFQPACLILLEKTDIALRANSNSQLMASDCGVHVNSTNKEAILATASSNMTAKTFCVVGNYRENGGDISPDPKTGCPPVTDPLAKLPEPPQATSPCQYSDVTLNHGESKILSPGVYCQKLTINGGATATLTPGIYIFRDMEVVINSDSKLIGDEVMLFFSGKEGRLNVNGKSTILISAPRSGTYQGILIFQSRDSITLETGPFIINSDGVSFFEGTIYMPNGQLRLNSESKTNVTAAYTALVARRLELNSYGMFNLNANYKGKTPPPPALANAGSNQVRLTK